MAATISPGPSWFPPAPGCLFTAFIADAQDVVAAEVLTDLEARRIQHGVSIVLDETYAFKASAYRDCLDSVIHAFARAQEMTPETTEAVEWFDLAYELAAIAERIRVAL